MRAGPSLRNPAVPGGLVFSPQPHIRERGVDAVANDPAIPKPKFVDALRTGLAWPLRSQTVNDVRPRSRDGPQDFPRGLLEQLRRNHEQAGVRTACRKDMGDCHRHQSLARAHLGDDSNRIGLAKPCNRAGNGDFLGGKRLAEQFADNRRNRIAGCV